VYIQISTYAVQQPSRYLENCILNHSTFDTCIFWLKTLAKTANSRLLNVALLQNPENCNRNNSPSIASAKHENNKIKALQLGNSKVLAHQQDSFEGAQSL
jgi:hypothetical protein